MLAAAGTCPTTEMADDDRRLPGGLHLAARPEFVTIAAVQGLRDRRRLPARAGVRPAGGRRRRPVLHEGAGARPGAGPDGNKAAGRACWLLAGAGDLRHRPVGRRADEAREHRAGHRRRAPATTWTATVADLVGALTAPMHGAVTRDQGAAAERGRLDLEEQRLAEREAQVRRFRELAVADGRLTDRSGGRRREDAVSMHPAWVRRGGTCAPTAASSSRSSTRRHRPPGLRLRPAAPAADRGLPGPHRRSTPRWWSSPRCW